MTTTISEQYDSDLALALSLQQEFDQEYEEHQSKSNKNPSNSFDQWNQIQKDEEYAKKLEALINGTDTRTSYAVASNKFSYNGEKLYSDYTDFDDEELETIKEMDKIEREYYNPVSFPEFESDPSKQGRIDKKNYNLDKKQKDKFSLLDHMKHEFPSTEFHQTVLENLTNVERMKDRARVRHKDKAQFSTQEQVLDYRTRLTLFKMINNPEMELEALHGCVSTGKEANLYYGESKSDKPLAVKIFKTSMLEFKDREPYVVGEYRFRRGYSKSNYRKMVEKWALKEYSNTLRLYNAGIPCPKPIEISKHIYVMEFIGKEGWPAKRLQEAKISSNNLLSLYLEIIKIMRNMYQKAKLVHADLSAYNILYFKSKPYIIDVSQSISDDHPNAMIFLRSDCDNITNFFKKRGLENILSIKELFDFIVSKTIPDYSVDTYLNVAIENAISKTQNYQQEIDSEVFKNAFIPRTLHQVVNFEQHFESVQEGMENTDQLFYREVVGINMELSGPAEVPEYLKQDDLEEQDIESNSMDEKQELESNAITNEDDNSGVIEIKETHEAEDADSIEDLQEDEIDKFESFSRDLGVMLSQMEKKERKAYVKEFNKKRREQKMPKHEKKALIEQTSRRKKK